jgi:hypothetical protein
MTIGHDLLRLKLAESQLFLSLEDERLVGLSVAALVAGGARLIR